MRQPGEEGDGEYVETGRIRFGRHRLAKRAIVPVRQAAHNPAQII
jgi:hypothetical protein